MLTVSEISTFISDDENSQRKQRAKVGQRYYDAEHDILNCRLFYYNADGKLVEDTTRSNVKIVHPFFTELADQIAPYMLSYTDNPIRAIETAEGLQDHLDKYFDDAFWVEVEDLVTGVYVKGFDYMYGYKNADDRLAFLCADGLGVVEVPAKYASDGQDHFLYWYVDRIEKGKKVIKRIQDHTKDEIAYYIRVDNGQIMLDENEPNNPCPNVVYKDNETGEQRGRGLGFVPFWRMDFNKRQTSGLKPIKGLIDDYDMMQCGLSNNLADFDTPLHVVSGFQGDNLDELQQNLKTKKIVGVDAEGSVQIQTVNIPYQARQAKAADDEKNIYRFGMGLNMLGLKDTSATTNMAIKAAYSLLDIKANKLEKRLKKLLREIIGVVLDEINAVHKTDYQQSDVYFEFTREVMTNDTENTANAKTEAETRQIEVNTILNIAAQIGDEAALKAICEIMDMDFNELSGQLDKLKEEQNTANAKNMLADIVPEDEGNAAQPVLASAT